MLDWIGKRLAQYLTGQSQGTGLAVPTPPQLLLAALQPGDVLLVEGQSRISSAIKYLTQSTWSHSALFVGDHLKKSVVPADHCFVEADLVEGVRSVGIEEFAERATRICRPVGMKAQDIAMVTTFAISRIGYQYDLRNVIDLARYLLPNPPVPTRFRRRMIALGSGDPTRAICSTLIAQAFQSVRYPILPEITLVPSDDEDCNDCVSEILKIRHHTLFAPRDFDLSPYFKVVKPALETGFDPYLLTWDSPPRAASA
jgi:hypothetical protein